MDKYYKVVGKLSDGRLVSCCAGNKEYGSSDEEYRVIINPNYIIK